MWLATKRLSGWPRSSWSIFFMCQQCFLLCRVPRAINLLPTILYWNYQHDCFSFRLLGNGCSCVCRSFTKVKGHLQNPTVPLSPLWTPRGLARVQSLPCFLAEFLFQAWCSSSLCFPQLWVTVKRVTFRPGLSRPPLAVCFCVECSSCLPWCSIRGPVGAAASSWQSCKKLSLLWTYIHYCIPWKTKTMVISALPCMVLNTSCKRLSNVVSTTTEARNPLWWGWHYSKWISRLPCKQLKSQRNGVKAASKCLSKITHHIPWHTQEENIGISLFHIPVKVTEQINMQSPNMHLLFCHQVTLKSVQLLCQMWAVWCCCKAIQDAHQRTCPCRFPLQAAVSLGLCYGIMYPQVFFLQCPESESNSA